MSGKIVIINSGVGNIKSVYNALRALGEKPEIAKKPSEISNSKGIILPGVGSFHDGMKNLREQGLIEPLEEQVLEREKPYLGICLGMQFLASKSYEHGEYEGFGWIPGTVEKIESEEKGFQIPHIGWNEAEILSDKVLYQGFSESPVFYFVHSYHFQPENQEATTSKAWHGTQINASIREDNIFGVQFHPEKSQGSGLKVLGNFIDFANKQSDNNG